MFGFHFGVGGRAGTFAPAAYPLTMWLRSWTGSSPWVGTASTGISANEDATGSNVPATFALNGHNTADFDGTNDRLQSDSDMATYSNLTSFSGWMLVNSDTSQARTLAMSTSFSFRVRITTTPTVEFTLDANATTASRAFTHAAWQLVTFRYNGSNIQVGVNEAPGAAGGGSSVAFTGNIVNEANIIFGEGSGSTFFNGKMGDIGFTDQVLDDSFFTKLRTLYINPRYALSL